MTDVVIPIHEGISYLPIALNGTTNPPTDGVEITGISLGNTGIPINSSLTIPSTFLEPINGDISRQRLRQGSDSYTQTLEFPARTLNLVTGSLAISWTLLRLRITIPTGNADITHQLEAFDLQLSSAVLPDVSLAGDLRIVFDPSGIRVQESYFKRYEPDARNLVPMDFLAFDTTNEYFALQWRDPNVNYWLGQLAANFGDEGARADHIVSLRIVFGEPIPEVRLDWEATTRRSFVLPGLKATTPASARLSLLLRSQGQSILNQLQLIFTLTAGQTISASSNFAWERDSDRELQNDSDRNASQPPLFEVDFGATQSVSMMVLELNRSEVALPRFFRQLDTKISPLDFQNSTTLPNPSTINPLSLQGSAWTIAPRFRSDLFTFPFLRNDSSSSSQFLNVSFKDSPTIDLANHSISLEATANLGVKELALSTVFEIGFNWETFALIVDHGGGIDLFAETSEITVPAFLGLNWRFQGADVGNGRYHLMTIVTKDFNYQIQQASGSVIELDYTAASRDDEPITFSVRDFAISEMGITLTAQVTDRPARLNGLDTRFRFHGSQLSIVNNSIQDFTLAGSGPLPPTLVGDAIADISLQFSQRDNGLALIAGSASLQGEKLLDCQATRFKFSIDGIGLKFVNDGRFHLYFTLTGTARYSPLPTDDKNGPLALLSSIQIALVECPLTGDASVIRDHVQFLIELPEPVSFSFLGCFTMEIRSIGFVPQFERFDDDGAMEIGGQIMFSKGGTGDLKTVEVDFHSLFVGLPAPGSFIPRLYLQELEVTISLGEAFNLHGVVEFRDETNEQGFLGEGTLEIPGMPVFAASFAFLRVRQDESAPWVVAWFIFLEIRQISFYIPRIELYIREVGLGFGYRFTLTSIRTADQEGDLAKLIGELRRLSRTQGNLSKRDAWAVDLEERGEDPRWTIVARALISQTSATPGTISLKWLEQAERFLPCLFLFDAVIAFRSDLTFFMAVRAWINTNYYGFVNDINGLRTRPLFSGFILLSVRQRRFIAQLSSNPDGSLGNLPAFPEFLEEAIVGSGQFSATLLIEPGLVHAEMGWPNMLRWRQNIGPFLAEISGGFIFRVTKHYLLLGISYKARASLGFSASLSLGVVGVRVSAQANAAFGARMIGLVDFNDPTKSTLHAGIGLEIRIRVSIALWIKFLFVRKTFRFSLTIGFTAGLEIGFDGITNPGLRGSGTLFISAMGRRFHVSVRVGINEGAVQNALDRTAPFLDVGLEATDVDRSIPGVAATQNSSAATSAPRLANAAPGGERTFSAAAVAPGTPTVSAVSAFDAGTAFTIQMQDGFNAPDYDIFVVYQPDSDGWRYFVLLPRGEAFHAGVKQNQIEQPGFLPVPPAKQSDNSRTAVENDFTLRLPVLDNGVEIEQFLPVANSWTAWTDESRSWQANWNTPIEQGENFNPDNTPADPPQVSLTLADYLDYAFKIDDSEIPVGDPDPVAFDEEALADERVQNPTEDAYEAAVRGAVEQFRSSPFFKRDPNSIYEQVLDVAFRDNTTIYSTSGQTSELRDPGLLNEEQTNQQAHQLRGMVVQDMIGDVQTYAAAPDDSVIPTSVGFQMGLVFRVRLTDPDATLQDLPVWLRAVVPPDQAPAISQRLGIQSSAPDPTFQEVRTFNILDADFSQNPPQFEQVQPLTDTDTIAIAWDLVWDRPPAGASPCQQSPEHHLLHYQVRRRVLDGSEPEVVYTVKTGEAVHKEIEGGNSLLQCLRSRFQVVDHFTDETLEDQIALPETGRSYLYTITPVDFSGNIGRPLTLIATRFPSEPPRVPVDGKLLVRYQLDAATLDQFNPDNVTTPALLTPTMAATGDQAEAPGIVVTWSKPADTRNGPLVPVAKHCLVFRRDNTLPLGSYGMDSPNQGKRSRSLPTSNARPLPTDIKIELGPEEITETNEQSTARISLETLQTKGIFPAGESPQWQPESWRIFLQTVSPNNVPSALAPVQVLIRVESDQAQTPDANEERQPLELEWPPQPIQFSMLPPEDQRAITGDTHVPMPVLQNGAAPRFTDLFSGNSLTLTRLQFDRHPAGIRLVRLRWNQGASQQPDYPLDLNAGYDLLQLNVDAHTDDTFDDPARLAEALRVIQEVRMVPADDLLLVPNDTLVPNQWEAWYPSTLLRRRENPVEGSELSQGPWYSWRESRLEWPEWPGITDENLTGERTEAIHPLLQAIVDTLNENPNDLDIPRTYNVEVQYGPAMQPNDFATFQQNTPPKTDPYGWGILQRLGLSIALTLREESLGELVTGEELLTALNDTLEALKTDPILKSYYPHLYLELLVQPNRSIRPDGGTVDVGDLLAIAQLSLRPLIDPYLEYGAITISGTVRSPITLNIGLTTPCCMVNQSDTTSGPIELDPATNLQYILTLPLSGETTLLIRSSDISRVQVTLDDDNSQDIRDNVTLGTLTPFPVTDERSTYFTVPDTLAEDFSRYPANASDRGNEAFASGIQWHYLKRYLESINTTDPTLPRIQVPTTAAAIDALPLADVLNWLQRFFDYSADVSTTPAPDTLSPWLVTAYPRVSTPAFASPDDSGRLQYDHLIDSQWAHNYRYYVRPYSRYELLWRSLLQSPILFPDRSTQLASFILSRRSLIDLAGKIPDPVLSNLAPLQDRIFRGRQALVSELQTIPEAVTYEDAIVTAADLFTEAIPDPQAGGLDVVIDRVRPVDKPLILNSSRLDAASAPGAPVPPGRTWEVLLAQHPEQLLIERNQTLARQLSFRQVAFTLDRRFAYPDWIQQLQDATTAPHTIDIEFVENSVVEIPTTYGPPDHIDLENPIDDATARSLDLPLRVGNFQQGVLAIQWDALPFYYEHRFMAVAQTTGTVSDINETTQRDFEYIAPLPQAFAESEQRLWQPVNPPFSGGPVSLRSRLIQIPLQRFWDSLPAAAQTQWQAENPDINPVQGRRKFSSLPDPEVVYQIVELFSGNVEVQAELFFDPETERYNLRQLGQRFLAETPAVSAPPVASQGDYILETAVQQVSQVELVRSITVNQIAVPTRNKIAFAAPLLSVAGIFRREDRDNILRTAVAPAQQAALVALLQQPNLELSSFQLFFPDPSDRNNFFRDYQTLEALYQSWFSQEYIAFPASFRLPPSTQSDIEALVALANTIDATQAPELANLIEFVEPTKHALIWVGPVSTDDADALTTLATAFTGDDAWIDAVQQVAAVDDAAADTVTTIPLLIGLERAPGAVQTAAGGTLQLAVNATSSRYTSLTWQGLLFDEQIATLRQWTYLPAFITAVNDLVQQLDAVTLDFTLPVPRPLQDELPNSIRSQFIIGSNQLTWQGPSPEDAQRSAIESLTGDSDFLDARQALLAAIDANQSVTLFKHLRQDQLPDSLQNRLTIEPAQLRWRGPAPTDEQRTALESLPGSPEFQTAVANLLEQIDQDHRTTLTQLGRGARTIPASLLGRLNIQTDQLVWIGPAPTDEQRQTIDTEILRNQAIEPGYRNATQALLQQIDQNYTEPLTLQPQADTLPASLRDQLQVEPDRLTWQGPAPTDEQRADLDTLTVDDDFDAALQDLIAAIDRDRTVPMVPRPDRPRQRQLPADLSDQLTLAPENQPTQATWTGRIHSAAQLQALRDLTGDDPFNNAINSIITTLQAQSVDVPFDLPVRSGAPGLPETPANQLPDSLRDRLLIGRILLRYHGLMTIPEGQQLQQLFSSLPNQAAIVRLFNASLNSGLDGSQLKIRTRRGSATPSSLNNQDGSLTLRPLA